MPKRVIVFAPHPDDETLGCGGTIAKKLREGYDVLIVFMTDGRNALSKLFNVCSNPTPLELREIRKEEAKKASKILGVEEEKLIPVDWQGKCASDDCAFLAVGVPAYRFIAYGDHHHRSSDTYENLNKEILLSTTRIIVDGIRNLAY